MERIPIEYGEFYDLPRQITFQSGDEWFLLRSYFDEEKDEYSDVYDVYLLPFRSMPILKLAPTSGCPWPPPSIWAWSQYSAAEGGWQGEATFPPTG